MKQEFFRDFSTHLLSWYDVNRRVLPWRDEKTPYRVWVSEVMLQQTRVEAAKPYFDRFLKAIPDIEALSKAEEEVLLKLWEGLGYYNRVRNLKKAAIVLMKEYNGELPKSYEKLKKLPGLGEYSAGAVASIAFNIPVPAVDGNVLRVFARLLSDKREITSPDFKKEVTSLIQKIQPKNRAGDFNQALMELGAMICLPNTKPLCDFCNLRELCLGYQKGTAEELPIKAKKAKRKVLGKTVFLLQYQGKTAIQKRKEKGLLAAMWEFFSCDPKMDRKEAEKYLQKVGIPFDQLEELGETEHIFTHIRWEMIGYRVNLATIPKLEEIVFADRDELLEKYAIPSAFSFYLSKA